MADSGDEQAAIEEKIVDDKATTPEELVAPEEDLTVADHDKILTELEDAFADRYTEKDEKFVTACARTLATPPLVHPWYSKPARNYDYNRRQHRDNDGDGHSGRRDHWHAQRSHHGRDDRDHGGRDNHHHSRSHHHHHHQRDDNSHHHNRYRQYSNNRHQPY